MARKNLAGLLVVAVALVAVSSFMAVAQDRPAGLHPPIPPAGKDVTMVGRLVDLHCFMVGMGASKEDPAKCAADCLKAGVPAALDTPTGLIILCKGMKGMGEFAAMAHQEVEVKGKMYEKGGVKYVDVVSLAKKTAEKPAEIKKVEPKKPEAPKAEVKEEEHKNSQPKQPQTPRTK